jgi:arylformamidase
MYKTKVYDLTIPITKELPVFPGDPFFKSEEIKSLDKGDAFKLCHIEMGNHMGTHIDFPAHVIEHGKTSTNYPIESLIGSGLIIELPDNEECIQAQFVQKQPIQKNDFVFFKTSNSKRLSKQKEFSKKFVYLEPGAAKSLIEKGVRIVGIDYLSIDSYEAEGLPVHRELLANEVLIVEGLNLAEVPPGRYKIYIMPTHILDMDGLPARVIAKLKT